METGKISRAADRSALSCGSSVTEESLAGREKQQVHLYLAGYVSMSHYVIDLLFGFHDQESQGSLFTCQVKQNQSQTPMTTKPQIPSGSITGL